MVMSCKLEYTEMSLASYKAVLESLTSHEQSAAESSTVMVQRRRSSFVRILPDYMSARPTHCDNGNTLPHLSASECKIFANSGCVFQ